MIASARLERRLLTGPALAMISFGSVALCVGLAFFSEYHTIVPVDLEVYLTGARHAFSSDLYRVVTPDQSLPFTYPPFAALAFLPFAAFPTGVVKGIWAIGNVAALVADIGFSIRLVRPDIERPVVWRWSLALSLPFLLLEPAFRTVTLGQVDLALLFPVLWDLGDFRKTGPRTLPVGLATGVAAAVKLVPLIFIPYLLLVRRTRAALTCAGAFIACELVALAASPTSSWQYWSKEILDTKRFAPIYLNFNQSIYAALGRLAHKPLPSSVGLGASVLAGALGLIVAVWAYRRSSPALGLIVAGATSTLASPITWSHHMVWVIPIIVWLAIAPDRPPAGKWIAAATAVLFWAAPIADVPKTNVMCPCSYIPELHENAWQLMESNSYFFATVVFIAGIAMMIAVRSRKTISALPSSPLGVARAPSPAHGGSEP
jgi:alpha-1,2-mannosyltransferase